EATASAAVLVVEASYAAGEPERYGGPLAVGPGDRGRAVQRDQPGSVVAVVQRDDDSAAVVDGMVLPELVRALLGLIERRRRARSGRGRLRGVGSPTLRSVGPEAGNGEVV